MIVDPMTMARARLALRKAVKQHLFDPNVRMVSLGLPEKDGQILEDQLAIRYHVREKFSPIQLEAALEQGATNSDLTAPIWVGRFAIQADVVQGRYRPNSATWRPALATNRRALRAEPLRGGISISDQNHNAYGTLGGKVLDRATGAEMILSNWHVLVADWGARPGLRIYQPGRLDGGTAADTIARLTRHAMRANLDAAVAALDGGRQLINDQFDLGPVTGVAMAELGMEVMKSGRRTGLTYGRVIDVEATARIRYGPVDKIIQHVISIEPRNSFEQASGPGDSGALWLDPATMQAVGLHFAGSDQPERALAMDLQPVLDALDVDLAIERPGDQARRASRSQALMVLAPAGSDVVAGALV